ncbi:MAG: dTDP-4-dehydrorhamnose 3,5-epimerase [Alphaproteobacteria bacterium]
MQVTSAAIPDVKLVRPQKHGDHRGFLSETFSKRKLAETVADAEFVQDNHSMSARQGTVRGLHFQTPPHAQGKLIRVLKGAIWDVAVDLRAGSPTFGAHAAAVLSAENWMQLFVPEGFAHGFCTLEPNTEILYKLTDYYAPDHEMGIKWDDPALAIDWPVERAEAILSEKDRSLPLLEEVRSRLQF